MKETLSTFRRLCFESNSGEVLRRKAHPPRQERGLLQRRETAKSILVSQP